MPESPIEFSVRQLDRLEMAFQALVYEKETGIDLADIHRHVRDRITDPRSAAVFAEASTRRDGWPGEDGVMNDDGRLCLTHPGAGSGAAERNLGGGPQGSRQPRS